jgi:hypothetical protein
MKQVEAWGLGLTAAAWLALGPGPAGAARAATPASSPYWAGYQVTEPSISRATMTFDAPQPDCPATGSSSVAVGIGTQETDQLPTATAVVQVSCQSGVAVLTAYAASGNLSLNDSVMAGDSVTASIVRKGAKVIVTLTNHRSGHKTRVRNTVTLPDTLLFGALPMGGGDGIAPVPDIGTVGMSQPYLNNVLLRDWSPTRLKRSDGSGVQVTTSRFGENGAFKLKFTPD